MNGTNAMWGFIIIIVMVVALWPYRKLEQVRQSEVESKSNPVDDATRDYVSAGYYNDMDAMGSALAIWDRASLDEVMTANTIPEIITAGNRAREGSLAVDVARTRHEEYSKVEVSCAGNDIEQIIDAANRAPQRGEARRVATAKLKALWKLEKMQ